MSASPLRVQYLDDGVRAQLLEGLLYRGSRDVVTVPRGFVTDYATVPWWAQWLTPRTGAWTLAAVVHDCCCERLNTAHRVAVAVGIPPLLTQPAIGSRDTDGLFRRIMRESGVDPVRRWLMWAGVRWGALGNPARRAGWWRDAPLVLAITLPAAVVAAAPVVLGVWGWLR